MKLTFRPALLQDANWLDVREEDRQELALYRETPAGGLYRSILESRPIAFSMLEGDTLVAIGGIATVGQRLSPWLMCSERVRAHPRALLRACRYMLGWLRFDGREVGNWVASISTGNQRFLRHLGFVIEPVQLGDGFDYFYLPEV